VEAVSKLVYGAVVSGMLVLLASAPVWGQESGVIISVDAQPDSAGIQTTRMMIVGETFHVDVVLENMDIPSYHAYQAGLSFSNEMLTPAGLPDDWATSPRSGESGNLATFPNGADCVPSPGEVALELLPEDNGRSIILMACLDDLVQSTDLIQPLVRFAFTCTDSGATDLVLETGELGTFLLEEDEHLDVANNARVSCEGEPAGDQDRSWALYAALIVVLIAGLAIAALLVTRRRARLS
jgi:hypothetical protein